MTPECYKVPVECASSTISPLGIVTLLVANMSMTTIPQNSNTSDVLLSTSWTNSSTDIPYVENFTRVTDDFSWADVENSEFWETVGTNVSENQTVSGINITAALFSYTFNSTATDDHPELSSTVIPKDTGNETYSTEEEVTRNTSTTTGFVNINDTSEKDCYVIR